jgi:rhodanese-related sulfurtransferase
VRGWWRYHHLFADLLRARLQAEQPGRVQALHRAAAGWCDEHDLPDDAVRHALAAGDASWAARLVERHDQLAARLAEFPENAEIIAYCRGRYCVFAPDAVRLLRARGFRLAAGGRAARLAAGRAPRHRPGQRVTFIGGRRAWPAAGPP